MKTSAESMYWYNKVDKTWKSIGVNPCVWESTPADYKIACKTIKALWKKEMGTKFPFNLKEVTGNKYSWCTDRKTYKVNSGKGWAEIIHGLGHYMGRMKNLKRPHCAEHAAMEYRLTKYVAETLKQAERNLAKVEKEITKYERVHSEEKRTTKYLEPINRKASHDRT